MNILRFTASWCEPCKALEKIISEAALPLDITIIDIENDPFKAASYGIRGVPTLVLMEGSTEVSRKVGLMTLPQLLEWVHASTPAAA